MSPCWGSTLNVQRTYVRLVHRILCIGPNNDGGDKDVTDDHYAVSSDEVMSAVDENPEEAMLRKFFQGRHLNHFKMNHLRCKHCVCGVYHSNNM